MSTRKLRSTRWPILVFAIFLVGGSSMAAFTRDVEVQKTKVYKERKKTSKPPAVGRYEQKASLVNIPDKEEIGITVWRLRERRPEDRDAARVLSQEREPDSTSHSVEWTAERMETETPLSAGERVRLTIESPRPGYLYVIDRETYSDGALGEPIMIFPAKQTPRENLVKAGQLFEVPPQADTPPYFWIKSSRPDHVGEMLFVVVKDKKIAELEQLKDRQVGRALIRIPDEVFARLAEEWRAVTVERFELKGGAGTPYTTAEQESGKGTRVLTQEDPTPQTVYRIETRPGAPLMVKVPLTLKSPPTAN